MESKQEKYNTWDNSFHEYIGLYDTSTGKPIEIPFINDSIRMSRTESSIIDDPDNLNSIVHSQILPTRALSNFIEEGDVLHARSALDNLGLYITDYIENRIKTLGDKEKELNEPENKEIIDIMTFRNYLKGGDGYIDEQGKTESESFVEESNGKRYSRVMSDCGIGLGESTVINPLFQFNKRDDPRTNPVYTKIGRVYSNHYMAKWPVVLIQPGRVKYNTGFFKLLGLGSGAGATEALIRSGGEGLGGIFAKLICSVSDAISIVGTVGSAIFGGSRVVEFKQSYNLYKQYVRFLLMNLASMMGLMNAFTYAGGIEVLSLDKILPGSKMSGVSRYINNQFLAYRCGKGITSSETFSNSTTSNPLMESMNSEAQANDEAAGNGVGTAKDVASEAISNPMGFLTKIGTKVATSVLGTFSEQALVLSGRGRVSLPDVFSTSSFSRSFSFSFKFHSAYGDPLSIFENSYLPFLTILGFSAPLQTGKLSYTSPFYVRVSVKNKIMINVGMVESLTVTRGGDSNDWTPSGFPKTITVDLQIKDLEPNISLPMASRGPLRMALEVMFPSTGISEYLSSLGGLTFQDIKMFNKRKFQRAGSVFGNAWNAIIDKDNLFSTVTNSRMVSNIMSLFAATDLDRINKLGDMSLDASETATNNMIKGKISMPGYYAQASAINGSGGLAPIKQDEIADREALEEISKAINAETPY